MLDPMYISTQTDLVSNNASLNINGSKSNSTLFENEVVFESDRLQPEYADVPGQWGHMAYRWKHK
jgi:hypothetical protein